MPKPETLANNRWLRWLGPSLLHPKLWHLSRRTVAIGAAVGVFFAFITPIAQIPLSAAVSILLRANVPAAVVGTLVNTPPTFGPVYYAAWWVGSHLLGEPMDKAPALLGGAAPDASAAPAAAPESGWWQRTRNLVAEIGKPLLVGTLIFSFAFSALTYGLVNAIWLWRVKRKRQRRLSQPESIP